MSAQQRMTEDYARSVARLAYVWAWPLVNLHNRLPLMEQVPEPGLLGGVIPAGPPGRLGMLHDYIEPDERLVACPNQDVVYGFGLIDAARGPCVIQVPDFGDRFWVYQVVDQRTDSFVRLGKMYDTAPGHYLLAPSAWDGEVPAGIAEVFRFDTQVAVCIPRVFMDDTDEDRAAIQPLINQIAMYPLADYTGESKTIDWTSVPTFPAGDTTSGEKETQWVDPAAFLGQLPIVLTEVPPRDGEQALYDMFTQLLDTATAYPEIAAAITHEVTQVQDTQLSELFEFRNIGIPVTDHWSTQDNGAAFGTDYLSRTAMARANIFVNAPAETSYFYQDLDADGERLSGENGYSITFAPGQLPPVRGFWSLTLYNQHHFFHPNDLGRYSLGTKNKTLHYAEDGSLTLYAGGTTPADERLLPNWLPGPEDSFALFLRAYWPDDAVTSGEWAPPPVIRGR